MTLIDEKLFERFLKSKETKVLDAVEEAEKNIENYNDSIESINTFFADYHKAKISLEIAYNSKDKSEINRQLKRLHEKEDILKDTLFTEQFFPVIESINKLLRKEIKIVK
jgi:Asp-tRNA(Asn)/Glu-tRNA(Gln) amidotransferase A subunit family amidase